MAKKVIWTPQAEKTFMAVINYLDDKWTKKEVEKFILATDKAVRQLSLYPEMYRSSNKTGIREALITKHNLLLYKIKQHNIDLITFWDTRKNPKKKPVQ